jgi:MYXO-CTERM domain-containing protein
MFFALTTAVLLAAGPVSGRVQAANQPQPAAGPPAVATRAQVASQLGSGHVDVQFDARGRVSLARGALGALGSDPLAFVRERSAPLGLRGGEGLVLLRHERVAEGTQHVRIGRAIAGVTVAFDQIRLHATADGAVYALEAETSPLDGFTYHPPAFPPTEAVRRAAGGYPGPWGSPPSTGLFIVGSRLDGVTGAHLAYRVTLAYPIKADELPRAEEVYLDAQTGEVLGRLSLVQTASTTVHGTNLDGATVTLNATQDTGGVSMLDTASVAGVSFALLNGANSNGLYAASGGTLSDRGAVSAAEVVARALTFDKATFGWDRWDFNTSPVGAGGTVLAIAHAGTNLNNAFFSRLTSNGKIYGVMQFGDGDGKLFTPLEKCLDVAGHELGHGVVAGNADLVYHNQSGALNEHFADVLGWLLQPADTGIGEHCIGSSFPGKALRDMCDPGNSAKVVSPQPANMSEYRQLADTTDTDNGGVHVNSGIPNHAACLYKQGSSFTDLGKVWFRALSQHLGPTSDFQAMVEGTMTSCTELGLTTCTALASAWSQVGLSPSASGGSCPPNSTPQGAQCVCNAGYHVNAAQTGCEADTTATCPPHATSSGGQCYCDTGYQPDATGQACVPINAGGCGANAHQEGASCVCDPCFQPGANESSACVAVPGCALCTDPLSYSDGSGHCVCIPGTALSGGACTPVAGTCGLENYTGRCVGDRLIYCDDTTSPIKIATIDCTQNSTHTVCAFGTNGFDCQVPASSCGAVPDTGTCVGNDAQYCSSGTLQSVACGDTPCRAYTYGGVAVHFCYPCPAHATWTDAAVPANGSCNCDTGYQPNAAGTACVATTTTCPAHSTATGTGCACDSGYQPNAAGTACDATSSGGGKKSGGCSTGGGGLWPALALGLMALLRRRRS